MSVPDPNQQDERPVARIVAAPWRRWLFVLLCLGLVVVRLIKPDVAVDGTTLWLLGIAGVAFTLPEVIKFLADFRTFEVGTVKFQRYEKEIQQLRQETELEIQRIKLQSEQEIERMRQQTAFEVRQMKQEAAPLTPTIKSAPTQPTRRKSKNRFLRAIGELRGKR